MEKQSYSHCARLTSSLSPDGSQVHLLKDRYNYTVTRHTEYRSNAMFVRSQIIPVDYQHSDTTELDKHYSQLSWWKKVYKSNPHTVYSFAGGASRHRDLCSKWGMWGKSCSRVGNFRNRRAATGVQTKVSEIEKGGELLLIHQCSVLIG